MNTSVPQNARTSSSAKKQLAPQWW